MDGGGFSTAVFGGKMTAKDVLADVARIAEGEDLYNAIKTQTDSTDENVKKCLDVLFMCYKNVIKDIALNYYEFVAQVTINTNSLYLRSLPLPAIKIISLRDKNGKEITDAKLDGDYLRVGQIPYFLVYRAIPNVLSVTSTHPFENTVIGSNIVVYGTLAEYCLVNSRFEEALSWESKYRQSLNFISDNKSRKMKAGKVWGL